MLYLNLSVGYQNIEGLHSNLFGCKLESEINLTCDIEILSETWSSCKDCPNIQPPGYVLVKSIDSEKKAKKEEVLEAFWYFVKPTFMER